MLTVPRERKAVENLRERILVEMHSEDVAVQIKAAFAVLTATIIEGSHRDPDKVRLALLDLQDDAMMKLVPQP
jgi:hypothetical protein